MRWPLKSPDESPGAVTALAEGPLTPNPFEVLRLALSEVPVGIVVSDGEATEVYRNEAAQWLLGISPTPALAEDTVQQLLHRAARGEPGAEVLELYGPPRQDLTITARPLRSSGEPIGAVAVIEDVSERRRLEAVRRDFVANITHELKTPVGALALLAETLAGEDDAEVVSRLAGRIQGEAQRVSRIMDDLLDLSRIESEMQPVTDPVSMGQVVSEATERVRATAEQRDIQLAVQPGPVDCVVIGDRRQLVSALYNLLENAVKYSDAGSSVEVEVEGSQDGASVAIAVRDHGIGIASRELERIFERFYRVDRARARDTGGTGLGLAIVRHVVSNHGGDVLVESLEGEGSTFTLRLPVASR